MLYQNIAKKNSPIFPITFSFIVLDILFTLYWESLYGIQIEYNPIGVIFLNHKILILAKVLVSYITLIFLDKNRDKYLYNLCRWILFIAYLGLVIYHIILFIVSRSF